MAKSYKALERERIKGVVSRFLQPMIDRRSRVMSVGCGAGTDVLELREAGYQAWGLDPSRLDKETLEGANKGFFYEGSLEERPFGNDKFNFIYALEVIEHVGCINFGTTLKPEARDVRKEFIRSGFEILEPGGKFLLTTSNRLCPVDVGHWHKYHWLGKSLSDNHRFGLSLPWDKRNFLLSYREIKGLLAEIASEGSYDIELVPTAGLPSLRSKPFIRYFLRLLDLPFIIGSPLSPMLAIMITRK